MSQKGASGNTNLLQWVTMDLILSLLRDWSLITGRGGGYKMGGGAREVLPLRKGGGGGGVEKV